MKKPESQSRPRPLPRKLVVRKESIAVLTSFQLTEVVGGSFYNSCECASNRGLGILVTC
jgi:hypothetical protein